MAENVEITVLGFVPYDFKDEDKKQVSGCNVWFVEDEYQNDDYGQGFLPKKASLPLAAFEVLDGVKFPCRAELVLGTRFTSKGAKTYVKDVVVGSPVELVQA